MTFILNDENMDMAVETPKMKIFVKDQKDFRYGVMPEPVDSVVHVYCLAVHEDPEHNSQVHIPLQGGIPIEGYLYNQVTDKYSVDCIGYTFVGHIDVAYRLKVEGVGNWHVYVPMPEKVIRRYMTASQKRELSAFRSRYKHFGDKVRFEYVQMLGAYPNG